MRGEYIERCATGISGFDEICQGGFVRNSVNVIFGGPGSGKTTFLFQFLFNGATKFNENGLYCSFEPDIIETMKDASAFGWDFAQLNGQDRVKFLKFSPETNTEDLKSELTKLVSKYGIRRICFDPVSVMALHSNDEGEMRKTIFELVSLMKRLGVTSVLADESIQGFEANAQGLNKVDVVNFLADSLTIFYEAGIQGNNLSDRAIRIVKMRRTNHVRTFVGMKIGAEGLEVLRV